LVGGLAECKRVGLDQHTYSTLGPVSAWMGDRLRAGKLSRYVTSHPGQLSLASVSRRNEYQLRLGR